MHGRREREIASIGDLITRMKKEEVETKEEHCCCKCSKQHQCDGGNDMHWWKKESFSVFSLTCKTIPDANLHSKEWMSVSLLYLSSIFCLSVS